MVQRHYIVLAGPTTLEVTDRVDLEGWELTEKAEEGALGSGTMWLRDPDMTLDIDGLRAYYVLEDESEAVDNVLFGGFALDPEQSHGEEGGAHFDPLGKFWMISLSDRNGFWNRRVMTGTDCKRPEETDVARMQWLYASAEADWIEDPTTYLSTGTTSAMDKNDYRGVHLDQVVRDAAEHTGKNWWVQLQETGTGRQDVAWYGKDSLTVYSSALYLSNDPADWTDAELAAGTSLVWPISDDTKSRRSNERTYTGGYLRYDDGRKAIYRKHATSPSVYGRRDGIFDAPHVRTKAKAITRLNRYLNDCADSDERLTTSVILPKGKATMIRAGMRVRVKATHILGLADQFYWLRVLECKVSPTAAGEKYKLGLVLQASGSVAAGTGSYTGDAFAGLLNQYGNNPNEWFATTGDAPEPGWFAEPTVGAMWTFGTGGSGYTSITTSASMRVRIECDANFYDVVTDGATATLAVKVNGTTIASDTQTYSGGLGIWSGTCTVDLEYDLVAGDVITHAATFTGGTGGGFGTSDLSVNTTYLRVGRGTHVWNSGFSTWVGA